MPQTIVALVGNNGAGKTTTLRAISGFIGLDDARVTAGRIRFAGQRIENQPPHANTARGIVLVPERDKVFPNLTVAENLAVSASRARQRRRAAPARRPGLPVLSARCAVAPAARRAALGRRAADAGVRQRHRLQARAAAGRRAVARPRAGRGRGPGATRRRASGRSSASPCCWWSRTSAWRSPIADYGYVLENGRVALEGAAAELRGRREIQQSYLGQASGEERRSYRALRARSTRMAELAVERLSLRFGGLTVLTDVSLHVDAGRAAGADRPERRRQDQRASTASAASIAAQGTIRLRGQDINGQPRARDRAARHRPHLPARRGVPADDGAGKSADRAATARIATNDAGRDVLPARRAPRGAAPSRGRREGAGLRRSAALIAIRWSARCRSACRSWSALPGRWRSSRRCCCSTSRRPA